MSQPTTLETFNRNAGAYVTASALEAGINSLIGYATVHFFTVLNPVVGAIQFASFTAVQAVATPLFEAFFKKIGLDAEGSVLASKITSWVSACAGSLAILFAWGYAMTFGQAAILFLVATITGIVASTIVSGVCAGLSHRTVAV